MGKDWDAPWKAGAGMTKPGIGDRDIPWPSFDSRQKYGGMNPTCSACGGRARGKKKCECEEPDWKVSGKALEDLDGGQTALEQKRRFQQWCVLWLTECHRVLRPGGVIKAFGATRTNHRLCAAMEDAGFVLPPEHSLEGWGYGCLSEDTEILTQEGWAPYHRAKVGTHVAGFDLKTGRFEWQPVEATFEYPYDRKAFRLVGDGSDHIVSIGHRSVVQRDGEWEFVRAQDLEGTETVPGVQFGVPSEETQPGDVRSVLRESDSGASKEALVGTEGANGPLHSLRDAEVVPRGVAEEDERADVLPAMQRGSTRSGLGEARVQGSSSGDSGGSCFRDPEDDRTEQPRVERRGDVLPEEGQLRQARADQVSTVPQGAAVDGSQGRLRDGAPAARGAGVGETVDPQGDGPSLEPQPRGQSAGEPGVVRVESGAQAVRAPREPCPHLAGVAVRVERIHYQGTVWCVRVASGAFVARRNGMAFVTGNSGFPKYLNTSKAIDAHFGKGGERPVVGENPNRQGRDPARMHPGGNGALVEGYGTAETEAATPEAAEFDGWATALKPGWEPFLVGVKEEIA